MLRDAVELAQRLKPDIVLLDYAMPEMNGVEASDKSRRNAHVELVTSWTVAETHGES